jgi:hypothetical protein
MDANGTTTAALSRQMQLRSQGPVDPLDTTHLNPGSCYVRSYNHNQQYNVNASYYTVSLTIKERRRDLIAIIADILGGDPRHWFEYSLRPVNLPLRPLDWSTTLLQQLRVFAQSLPCDMHNTSVNQRLRVAHDKMRTEASNSYGSEGTVICAKTDQPGESSRTVNEHDENCQLRADKQELLNQIQALNEESFGWDLLKELQVSEINDLKDELNNTATVLSECKREVV